MTIDLIAAAQAAYAAQLADEAQEQADAAATREESQADFLNSAAEHAITALGPAAEQLTWLYTPHEELPQHKYGATAVLPGSLTHRRYLDYRFDSLGGTPSLTLVHTCRSCSELRTDPVTSLADLGRLDGNGQDDDADTTDKDTVKEAGPLAAIERVDRHAWRVSRLARRLVAEHSEAGLTVDRVYFHGPDSGTARASLRLEVASVAGARQVAAALGVEVTTRHSNAVSSTVFERADAVATVDGIRVTLNAYTELTEAETTAWRAQQCQPTAGASDIAGGDA
ncbi:hypothetical protein [Streptomyces sp. NPDC047070]|uniref:hypothetical protein n=1 Tax=Streptomyces sp. NPDC047070 TaxID=3154923 RepID=UPI0034538CF7